MDCAGPRKGVVEFGCGYGIFTVPAARLVQGPIFALDIDPNMVSACAAKARESRLTNVKIEQRDFLAQGTGRPDSSVDYTMLFNILHLEHPVDLLNEAYRILVPGGKLGIIHWKHDQNAPRGPSLSIRPTPEQCRTWSEQAGFEFSRSEELCCCSWHYGLMMTKPVSR